MQENTTDNNITLHVEWNIKTFGSDCAQKLKGGLVNDIFIALTREIVKLIAPCIGKMRSKNDTDASSYVVEITKKLLSLFLCPAYILLLDFKQCSFDRINVRLRSFRHNWRE